MNTVKVVLGFLELALSLKFLSVADLAYGWHILDRETFLALWIAIFGLLGLYLLGVFRFKSDGDGPRSLGVFRFMLALVALACAVAWLCVNGLPAPGGSGMTEEEKPLGVGHAILLGAALAWSFLFRLNGIIALVVCGICCSVLLLKRHGIRQLMAMLLTIAISVSGISLYSTLVLRPEKMDNGFALQVFGSAIAAVVQEGELTPSELEEIDQVLPVAWMQEKYQDSYNKRPLLWDSDGAEQIAENPSLSILNNSFIIRMGENKAGVIRLFFRLLPKHFSTMARDILGSMAIVWRLNDLFFAASHVFWAVTLFGAIVSLRLRGTELLPFLPCVCNTLSVMAATATDEIRYLLPSFLLAPFFILYLIWKRRQKEAFRCP